MPDMPVAFVYSEMAVMAGYGRPHTQKCGVSPRFDKIDTIFGQSPAGPCATPFCNLSERLISRVLRSPYICNSERDDSALRSHGLNPQLSWP
jgi:hypothetical protein